MFCITVRAEILNDVEGEDIGKQAGSGEPALNPPGDPQAVSQWLQHSKAQAGQEQGKSVIIADQAQLISNSILDCP